jgi:hypothetical protein
MRFIRDVAPFVSVMSFFRTASAPDNKVTSATLAAPSFGAAISRTASHSRPSSAVLTPSIALRDARGVTRTDSEMPSLSCAQQVR